MRKVYQLAVGLLAAGCATEFEPMQTGPGVYRVTQFGATGRTSQIMQEAAAFCAPMQAELRSEVVLDFQRDYVEFSCSDPSSFGPSGTTDAVAWSPNGEQKGAFVSCPDRLTDCYRRAEAICVAGYQIAQQNMRGAVAPNLGSLDLGDSTSINVQQNMAVAQNGTAVIGGPYGPVADFNSSMQNGLALGAAMGAGASKRGALENQRAALADAAKEHGQLWVLCR